MTEPIPDAFRAALHAAVDNLRGLSVEQLGAHIFEMCHEAGVPPNVTAAQALKFLATEGSIDAVAAMVVLNLPQEQIAESLKALIRRVPDVLDGLVVEELTNHLEEYADAEVAAGRMTVTLCPKTGRKLYRLNDDADSA